MGHVKLEDTRSIPCQHPGFTLKGVHPDWETHPSWITGIEALNAYHFWVSEVVLPIAFQWIYENKPAVYATVPPNMKGDVGVVIAAAFQVIKGLPEYQNGMSAFQEYQQAMAEGTWDTTGINPVWTEIVEDIREGTKDSFEAQAAYLKDTIR